MEVERGVEVYQLHPWIRGISPMIYRRLWVRSDSTLATLHDAIQMAFGWTDVHLHRFRRHGKDYGIPRVGGPWYSEDARQVTLATLSFRRNERFLYEYDFGDLWQHEVRVERTLPFEPKRIYPVCIGGRRACPPEDCGGPWAYMAMVDHHRLNPPFEELSVMAEVVRRLLDAQEDDTVGDAMGDLEELQEAVDLVKGYQGFQPERFDRRSLNRRLKSYATGDGEWRWEERSV